MPYVIGEAFRSGPWDLRVVVREERPIPRSCCVSSILLSAPGEGIRFLGGGKIDSQNIPCFFS